MIRILHSRHIHELDQTNHTVSVAMTVKLRKNKALLLASSCNHYTQVQPLKSGSKRDLHIEVR
jgi:hypothetical protein